MKYDVFGIGSALMDFLIQVESDQLAELDLEKGRFHLIDEKKSKKILEKVKRFDMKLAPGGSSANALFGVALLGGKVVFCGKVGEDEHGVIYEQKMVDSGVKSSIGKTKERQTGHAITFITSDSERTFATHLGAALELQQEDVFFDDLADSKILHIEGYQLEDPNLRSVALAAMKYAKKHRVRISLDLADPGIVERNKKDLQDIVGEFVDILFANEDEATAFTGKEKKEALKEIAKMVDIAVVKLGEKGSLIQQGNVFLEAQPYEVTALDATGAGDMYAAGFLYGITHRLTLGQASRLGSYLGARVVQQLGARVEKLDQKEIDKIKQS